MVCKVNETKRIKGYIATAEVRLKAGRSLVRDIGA